MLRRRLSLTTTSSFIGFAAMIFWVSTTGRFAGAWTVSRTGLRTTAQSVVARWSSSTEQDTTTEATVPSTLPPRLPRNCLSVDLRTITAHTETYVSHLQSRNAGELAMQAAREVAAASQERVTLIQQRDAALQQRKEQSAVIGTFMRDKSMAVDEKEKAVASAKALSNQAAEDAQAAEQALAKVQSTMDDLLDSLPNFLDDRVPEGKDDTENEIVSVWGDPSTDPAIAKNAWEDVSSDTATPLWHDDVASKLGGYAADAAVAMSGARFVALTGPIAQLERALGMWLMDLHTTQHGYQEVTVPYVVGRSALYGTSQLPKFQDDLFAITNTSHTCNGEDAFLIPTAEVPVTNLHAQQVLEESQLPLSYVAWTPCFRAEAGSYGRDTKGLIRTHQFSKVELVKITTPETSDAQHEALTGHAEACLQQLELPYRKVRLCAGDIGFSAQHCYDLEVWLPGANEYREISSCSTTGDFQARRMGIRYRPAAVTKVEDTGGKKKKQQKAKPVLCHTINGSGLAVGRTLVAVLENYQQPDGSVVVPKVLRPYMGGKEVLLPPKSDKK